MTLTIAADGARLTLEAGIKPEICAAADKELPPGYPPAEIGLLPGDADEYIITNGGMRGARGFFTRDQRGAGGGRRLAGPVQPGPDGLTVRPDLRRRSGGST